MKLFTKILTLSLAVLPALSFAQTTVNIYGRVTAISGTSLTISNTTGTFAAGAAIVMQMQDSTVGTNTANNSSFGNLSNIQSAGLMEVVTITSAMGTSVTLSASLTNTYHLNNNSRVQIISYPTLGGGGNYTLTSPITGSAWNGNTGGVVAFKVTGILTLNSSITVDAQGFRGGAVGANAPSDFSCDPSTYYDNAASVSTTYYGFKGEGIYNPNSVYTVARGKMLNGGGGGNLNNAGGGGGGNFTAGGIGGQGWTCSASTTGGGIGGIDLSTYISSTRFFLGGGGGGGQQNNSVGTAGGNGGGIIMIKANSIITNAGCSAGTISISAGGQTSPNSGNDGAGGGGAGGSILIQSGSYTVNSGCPINMNTSGGNGGTVNNSGAHGGGAGGGKGVVIFAGVVGTPSNINVVDTSGTAGGDDNISNVISASNGTTSSSTGSSPIIYTPGSALPVKLTSFTVTAENKMAQLKWQTSIEAGFSYFEVERAVNNTIAFKTIGKVQAAGNNSSYKIADDLSALNASGVVYYRLKMVDIDGTAQYSDVRTISLSQQQNTTIRAYPNPAVATVYIHLSDMASNSKPSATIHDMQGRVVKYYSTVSLSQDKTIAVSVEGISTGQYIVTVNNAGIQEHVVITKQ